MAWAAWTTDLTRFRPSKRPTLIASRVGCPTGGEGFVTATQLSCDASPDGRQLGGHRHCVPLLHRLGSEEAQCSAGDQMALNIERVVDGGMQGEEALSRSCGLEPLHLSLASADRLVRHFLLFCLRPRS